MSAIQETFQVLTEIDRLLGDIELKINNIEQKTPVIQENLMNFRQLERVALRYLVLSRRMGMPDEVARATEMISRLIILIRMAQMSYNALMMGTPYGLLMGAASIGMTAFAAFDTVQGTQL